ncbi:unnamed protein product [Lupinus luteus]|uniref:VQ domain-containing protein n=1 Tax=Lupinus luteus TaxID=3873 RepID=A0AAV1YIF5_LUPLU
MKNKRQSRRDKKEIKVTYISSPMKVKTSASNFRALVQELTGQDSNVADTFMAIEENCANDERVNIKDTNQRWSVDVTDQGCLSEETLLKYGNMEFLSSSLMELEPLNQHLQYHELLSFDTS